MIPGFFETIQQDFGFIFAARSVQPKTKKEKEELKNKVNLAYLRIIGAVVMGFSTAKAINAVHIFLRTGAVSEMVWSIAGYILGHDLFRMGENISRHNRKLKKKVDVALVDVFKKENKEIATEIAEKTYLQTFLTTALIKTVEPETPSPKKKEGKKKPEGE